jgi:glycosyltransferase involved in cell wall biosynthesis
MSETTQSVSPLRRAWRSAPLGLRQSVNAGITFGVHHLGRVRGSLERGGRPTSKVCVMGLHRAVLGIGRGARLFQAGLTDVGIANTAWDVTAMFSTDTTLPEPKSDFSDVGSIVAHLNPIEHLHALGVARGGRPKRGFRAGYWAWETSQLPSNWISGIDAVDEVWCPSRFTADSVTKLIGQRRPVHVVPFPIPQSVASKPNKARFGLPEDKVVFLAASDLRSSMMRKNPLGAIEAFRRSGCGARGEGVLVVKVHGGFEGSGLTALEAAASQVEGVRILNQKLSANDMSTLQSSVDVVLSPHRSEGFGLVLAEAMRACIPVIATGWSGNMDFMDETSAALIRSKEVKVQDSEGVYATGSWAEPDLEHAGELIRWLANDHAARIALGQAGARQIEAVSDMDKWGHLVRQRLGLHTA